MLYVNVPCCRVYNVSARQLKGNVNSPITTSYHQPEPRPRILKLTLYTVKMSSSQSVPQELSEMRSSQSLETNQPRSQQSMGKTATRPDYQRAEFWYFILILCRSSEGSRDYRSSNGAPRRWCLRWQALWYHPMPDSHQLLDHPLPLLEESARWSLSVILGVLVFKILVVYIMLG